MNRRKWFRRSLCSRSCCCGVLLTRHQLGRNGSQLTNITIRANVCVGDCNVEKGKRLEAELSKYTMAFFGLDCIMCVCFKKMLTIVSGSSIKFVQCDTTKWDDQVQLFREAKSFSPTGDISYVVANAGISRPDEVFQPSGNKLEPEKPDLSTIDVNLVGSLYTVKLALHYFVSQNGQQPSKSQKDTCLILIGSGAAFVDVPRTPQYCATKWAMRGIMHSLRRTAFYYGSRVNIISPWYAIF